MVQWLRLHTSKAGGLGSMPAQGTRYHVLQLRAHMPQTKDATRCNQDPGQPKKKKVRTRRPRGPACTVPECRSQRRPSDHVHPPALLTWTARWPCTPPPLHPENGRVTIWLEFSSSETWSGLCLTNQLCEKKYNILGVQTRWDFFSPWGASLW